MACIVGVEPVDYISKKTGKAVKGYRFHATQELQKGEGLGVISEYVAQDEGYDFIQDHDGKVLGSEVEFIYNKFGKCAGLREVKTA
jgi:hypothetical protein